MTNGRTNGWATKVLLGVVLAGLGWFLVNLNTKVDMLVIDVSGIKVRVEMLVGE